MRLRWWLLASALVLGHVGVIGQQKQVRIVPAATWVEIYFQSIDELAGRVKLRPLRAVSLPPGDLEIRIWEGFGLSPLRGFVLKHVGGEWSAFAPTARSAGRARLADVPRSANWAKVWAELEQGGILDLRDDSETPACWDVLDGVGYVVEIARAGYYRTYLISNPQSQRSEDGDRFLRLLPTLHRAFGVEPTDAMSRLPSGQVEMVSSVVGADPRHIPSEPVSDWRALAGAVRVPAADVQLTTEEAVVQSVTLATPGCRQLPPVLRMLRIGGSVVVEVRIAADGTVSAARALSGPPLLRGPSVESALKWRFKSLRDATQTRGATLTINYREEWVRFPWIK